MVIASVILLLVLAGFIVWLRFSIWKVKPEERAIGVVAGIPRSVHKSGFCFIPKLPGSQLIRIPSKQFKVSVSGIQVYSRADTDCARELLTASVVFYLNLPSGRGLIDAYQAGMPTKEEDFLTFFGPAVKGATKQILAGYAWRDAISEMGQIEAEIESLLLLPGMVMNDFVSRGGRFRLVVEGVDPPDSLKAAISYVSQRQVASEAKIETPEQRAEIISEAALERLAKIRGTTVDALKRLINDDKNLAGKNLRDRLERLTIDLARNVVVVDSQLCDGQQTTTFHAQGPERVVQNLVRSQTGRQSDKTSGANKGKDARFPDGTNKTLSDEDRKRRGLSF